MEMRIYNHVVGLEETDTDKLMRDAGLDPRMGFGGLGIDDEFLPLVFDKCGSYGHLDSNIYRVRLDVC